MSLFCRNICINAAVRSVFVHLVDSEQERIVENVDDALAGLYRIFLERFVPSILIIFQGKCVVRSVFDHYRAVQFGRKNNSWVRGRRCVLVVIFIEVRQALSSRPTVNLSIIFLLVAMQKANLPPLFASQQIRSLWNRITLCCCHFSDFQLEYRISHFSSQTFADSWRKSKLFVIACTLLTLNLKLFEQLNPLQ